MKKYLKKFWLQILLVILGVFFFFHTNAFAYTLPTSFPYSFDVADMAVTSTDYGNVRSFTMIDASHLSCSDSMPSADHTMQFLWGGGFDVYGYTTTTPPYLPVFICNGTSQYIESHWFSSGSWGVMAFGEPTSTGWVSSGYPYDVNNVVHSNETSTFDYVFQTGIGSLGWTFFNPFPVSVSSPGPTISFTYPQNGTTTEPFDKFTLNLQNLNATHTYQLGINATEYGYAPNGLLPETFKELGSYTDYSRASGLDYSSQGAYFNFLYDTRLNQPGNFYWTVYADLLDGSTPWQNGHPVFVATTSISFYQKPITWDADSQTWEAIIVTPSSTAPGTPPIISTTTTSGIDLNSTTTPSGQVVFNCKAPSNPLDVGGGVYFALCGAIKLLFDPSVVPQSQDFLNTSLTKLESVPPFSPFFDIASSTLSELDNMKNQTTSAISLNAVSLDGFTMKPLITLTSTTLYQGSSSTLAHGSVGEVVGYANMWLWIFAGIKILGIFVFHVT